MTRERIVDAARAVMAERGWTGATIEAIAEKAGVATPTVYSAFGTKLGILEAMRHVMLRDSRIPELTEQARTEPDAARRLGLWATLVRQQMESSYDIISIHRQAALADPRFATEYRKVLDNRARHFAEFVRDLGDDLPREVDTRTATDLLWAFSNEELWRELVEERGWSPDRYERWLAATLVTQLLDAPTAVREPRRTRRR
jgi:AcrR family transcriptional regulator